MEKEFRLEKLLKYKYLLKKNKEAELVEVITSINVEELNLSKNRDSLDYLKYEKSKRTRFKAVELELYSIKMSELINNIFLIEQKLKTLNTIRDSIISEFKYILMEIKVLEEKEEEHMYDYRKYSEKKEELERILYTGGLA